MNRRSPQLVRAFVLTSVALIPALLCAAAAERKSVLELYQAIPPLPSTAAEAARWVDKGGKVIHPPLLALRADIAAHKRSIEPIAMAGAQQAQQQGQIVAENMQKGMANVGIDMARMQRDPAYAAQVQEQMKKMSPAEVMAMAQKMNQPLQQDSRVKNEAAAMVQDPQAAQAAAQAGGAFSAGQQQRLEAHMARWNTSEQAVKAINAKPLNPGVAKPTQIYDDPACNPACNAAWNAYADRMLPLLVAPRHRDTRLAGRGVRAGAHRCRRRDPRSQQASPRHQLRRGERFAGPPHQHHRLRRRRARRDRAAARQAGGDRAPGGTSHKLRASRS